MSIAGILAVMWLWTGIAYHGLSFSVVNKAAYLFAALFVYPGLLSHLSGRVIVIEFVSVLRPGAAAWAGAALVAYAADCLSADWRGHRHIDTPRLPMFGVTPCPVTIFHVRAASIDDAPCTARASCHSFCLVADRRQCRRSPPRAARLASPRQRLHRSTADGLSRPTDHTQCRDRQDMKCSLRHEAIASARLARNPAVAGFPVSAFHRRPGDAMSGPLAPLRTARLIFRPGIVEGGQVDLLRVQRQMCPNWRGKVVNRCVRQATVPPPLGQTPNANHTIH